MRSRAGYSGSPVFIYRTPSADLTAVHEGNWNVDLAVNFWLRMLGVHVGQYWEPMEFRKAPPQQAEKRGDPIVEGDRIWIQSSLTLVAPAWQVSSLLRIDIFEQMRVERDLRGRGRRRPIIPRAEAG